MLVDNKECFLCKAPEPLHVHHIFEGSRRQISEKEGMTLYLCPICHKMVHENEDLNKTLKRIAEKEWIKRNNSTIEGFVLVFGKNYLV